MNDSKPTSTENLNQAPSPKVAQQDAAADFAALSGALSAAGGTSDRKPAQSPASWWSPSFADMFLLALVLWTFVSGPHGWASLLTDGDAGWHIRTGEAILDSGSVPRVDPYSFSKPGQPWFAWEWLSDVGMGALHRAGGLKAIVWFSAVLIAAFAGVLLRYMMWKGANALVALVMTLVAVGACSIHFLARPHLTTLLLVPVTAWMIEADRRKQSGRIWLLVPLMAVWTNLHGGFVAGILLTGATAVGVTIECLAGNRILMPAYRYGILTALCSLATVVNPYGVELHKHLVHYLQSDWIRNAVQEFQSPTFRGESAMQFEGLLFLGLVAAAYQLRAGRIVEALWIAGLAHMALGSQRHITLYSAVAGPFVALQVTEWWNQFSAGKSRKSVAGIFRQLSNDLQPAFSRNSVWIAVALLTFLAFDSTVMRWPKDFTSVMFPTELMQKYKARIAASRTLTTDQWGDYLLYHNPSGQKVFVDGRSDFYGPEIGKDYLAMLNGAHNWEGLMRKYNFNFVVSPSEWPLNSLLKRSPDWKLLEDNGKALVFERISRSPGEPKF